MLARGFCGVEVAMTCGRVGSGLVPELWSKPLWEKVWPSLDAWDSVRASTHSFHAVEYGLHGELLFFLIQKKPATVPDSEAFNSFIGDGFRVPELKGEGESSDGSTAGHVNNEALYVIGLHGSGDNLSLPAGLGVGNGVINVSHGPGHIVPGSVRTGNETWLVWVLSGPADFFPFKICCIGVQTCLGVVNRRRAEGLPPHSGIDAENSQRLDWFLLSS